MKICFFYKNSMQVSLMSPLGAHALIKRTKEGTVNHHVQLVLSRSERKAFVCSPLLEGHLPLTTKDFW